MSLLPVIQVITPEAPCRVTWDRYRQQPPMSNELADLLREVEELRKETDALICHCNQPNCPFHNGRSTGSQSSLNSLEFSQSSEEDDRLSLKRQFSPPTVSITGMRQDPQLRLRSTRSTGNLTFIIPAGVQRRADGTIVEGDYPRYSRGQPIKMRRCGTYNGFTQTNYLDIANCIIRENEDCAVDYENTFTNEGYQFSRQAPERKQFRSPKAQKKGHSKLKNSASYPVGSDRKISSPAMSHKSIDSDGECHPQRGRSCSSPTVTRHMSIDQSAQKWSPEKKLRFERSSQQA